MPVATILPENSPIIGRLYIAFELSSEHWRLAFSDGGQNIRQAVVKANDLVNLSKEIEKAMARFKLPADCEKVSCYEAGRDGFWLHRYLLSIGVVNFVVDSASIQVNRRHRQAKTDRLDAHKLAVMLLAHYRGENVWSLVNVPSEADEDDRRINRELERLTKERTAHSNRITSLLITQGIRLEVSTNFAAELKAVRLWNGQPVGASLKSELLREFARYTELGKQIKDVEKERARRVKDKSAPKMEKVRLLKTLSGIGDVSSWTLVMEFFGWRHFRNGKEVGSLAGLAPTPFSSGKGEKEQGISKAGRRSIRALMVEIAWFWLRYQPDSKLSRWFNERFSTGARMRRIGIVAVARKLLVALWQFVEKGVIPEGAKLKAA